MPVIGHGRTGAAATDAAVLRRAGVSQARCVVVTCMDDATTAMVVTPVRRAGPQARIVVAVRQPQHVSALRQAGADLVVPTERIGAHLAAMTLTGLGTAQVMPVGRVRTIRRRTACGKATC
ncbi:NAD-binding protein [Saccharothrix sp. 6-C]|uniref:NAD-binding protein n=1 Tax=Saccharothrix sp. 6-C TaxID=2781735 RepID=UPI0019175ACA|nr:NAD-binding protein [Saccharothrix sp. 6-C]QQQ79432.1 NAD-binding protein [Saccharothrix sp. 6-C]